MWKQYRLHYNSDVSGHLGNRVYPPWEVIKATAKVAEFNFLFAYLIPGYLAIKAANALGIYIYDADREVDYKRIIKETFLISIVADFCFYGVFFLLSLGAPASGASPAPDSCCCVELTACNVRPAPDGALAAAVPEVPQDAPRVQVLDGARASLCVVLLIYARVDDGLTAVARFARHGVRYRAYRPASQSTDMHRYHEALVFALPQALPPILLMPFFGRMHLMSMWAGMFFTQMGAIFGHAGWYLFKVRALVICAPADRTLRRSCLTGSP